MAGKDKIRAAVGAGIYMYLLEEEQCRASGISKDLPGTGVQEKEHAEAISRPGTQEPRQVFRVSSPWALSGRQAIMDRRYQLQFKVFR